MSSLVRAAVVLGVATCLAACGAAPDDGESSASSVTASCGYTAGALPRDTLKNVPAHLPIRHVIVVMQENRSFDHILGSLAFRRSDVDGIRADYVNYDKEGNAVHFTHRTDTCFDADSPHDEESVESSIHGDKMDDFVLAAETGTSNGHYVMSYYTEAELPFHYFLADNFAISDRYFSALMGPTNPNRDFMYAATSNGDKSGAPMTGVKTIYDALSAKKVSWGVYSSYLPRQRCLGWDRGHAGFHDESAFFDGLEDGDLPEVAFLDPGLDEDEHPPHDVQAGDRFAKKIYDAVRKSPLWADTAVFFTYDEAGGIADHVAPPSACAPTPGMTGFDRLGVRVPVTVVSPYAKRGYVSHEVHSHTSILRFIELLHDIPALTSRDANSDAMLDMFDFSHATSAPSGPEAGEGACVDDPSRSPLSDIAQNVGNWVDKVRHWL